MVKCASPLFWPKIFACCLERERLPIGTGQEGRRCYGLAEDVFRRLLVSLTHQWPAVPSSLKICVGSSPPTCHHSLSSVSSAHFPVCLLNSLCFQHLSIFALLCLMQKHPCSVWCRNIDPVTALHLVSLCFLIACLCTSCHTHGCHSWFLAVPEWPGTSFEELCMIDR